MVYKFLDKKSSGGTVTRPNISAIKSETMTNQRPLDLACIGKVTDRTRQLAKELHKPVTRKFEKRKVHSSFKDDIWGADLADVQSISKHNKEFRFLSCVIGIFSYKAWVVPFNNKKSITITDALQKILDESNRKPNKTLVDKRS